MDYKALKKLAEYDRASLPPSSLPPSKTALTTSDIELHMIACKETVRDSFIASGLDWVSAIAADMAYDYGSLESRFIRSFGEEGIAK